MSACEMASPAGDEAMRLLLAACEEFLDAFTRWMEEVVWPAVARLLAEYARVLKRIASVLSAAVVQKRREVVASRLQTFGVPQRVANWLAQRCPVAWLPPP